MVFEKVLVVMEVEQHKFMLQFYFYESCEDGMR